MGDTDEIRKFPTLGDVDVYPSRRVLFDLQGQIFGVSVDVLKNVPDSLLFHLAFDEKFKNKEPDGTIFINRSPKHFGTIINIISNSSWNTPQTMQECEELKTEVDFYCFPDVITKSITYKVKAAEDSFERQIKTLQDKMTEITNAYNLQINILNSAAIRTDGIYVSISEPSFSVFVARDFKKIYFSFIRMPYSNVNKFDRSADIYFCNKLKSYIGCEIAGLKMDLYCIRPDEIIACVDAEIHSLSRYSSLPSSSFSSSKSNRDNVCLRISCRLNQQL